VRPPSPRNRWARLLTESRSGRSRGLDALPVEKVVALILDEDRRAILAAARQGRPVARAAQVVADALDAGGRLLLLGAGTSGRLGVIEAAECPPTFGTRPDQIQAVMAGGRRAVFRSVEGAEDDGEQGRRQGRRLRRGDVLVGISASSVTPFVRGALAAARSRRATTVLITCAPGRGLRRLADVVIVPATGPEVLTGSTRLKAGSATKAVLNAITTAAMVRLGKVYENWPVGLRQASAKLRDRARRIVAAAAKVRGGEARRLLEAAGGDVKLAVLMGRARVSASRARSLLASAGGHLRRALALARPNGRPS
jgi:N-acetylmuramic acid 6-phosphate etherase